MSDTAEELKRQIAELEAQLPAIESAEDVKHHITKLTAVIRAAKKASAQAGPDTADGNVGGMVDNQGRINGIAVGVNLGAIIYGRAPDEVERRRIAWYLDTLANKLNRLPLRSLEQRLDQGDGIALHHVYVMLATTSQLLVAKGGFNEVAEYCDIKILTDSTSSSAGQLARIKDQYHPNNALPTSAIVDLQIGVRGSPIQLFRQILATEAAEQHSRLVLLGDPGCGKSTFICHLAWALAQRGLDQDGQSVPLFGWPDDKRYLPLLLPLRALVDRVAVDGAQPAVIVTALGAELATQYSVREAEALVEQALHSGAALVLFDGLDEVPIEGKSSRRTVLRAIREFARLYRDTRVILTCRARAFDESLRTELGWHVETLAPFTLSQIRYFVEAWDTELATAGQIIHRQVKPTRAKLIGVITDSRHIHLRAMAENPLLLTLMALVFYDQGELPRDRPQLYERILDLLLDQWDTMRDGQGLADTIGLPFLNSTDIHRQIDQLSYQAHLKALSRDSRGRLARSEVRDVLESFFLDSGISDDAAAAVAVRCLGYISERSELIVPDDKDSFAFASLTMQEYCAGRYIALGSDDPVTLIMRRRMDDRWREPILLGLGAAQKSNPFLIDRVLSDLIDWQENEADKDIDDWLDDLLLADEIGQDRGWEYLQVLHVNVRRIQRDLKRGIATCLAHPRALDRQIQAAETLGRLGDPRIPATISAWYAELARRNETFGQPEGYWCYVPPGDYHIGDWEKRGAADIPLQAYWITRFPITVAQFAPFVAAGYGDEDETERWWTPEGKKWKRKETVSRPHYWQQPPYNGSNQPVIGVTWYEAMAYCAWLSEQLRGALPEGYVVRLPTEAEWEAAASCNANGERRFYPWGEHEPTTERAIFDTSNRGRPVPVGCCPAGMASCGALDMAGNVWEWTLSRHQQYPNASQAEAEDFARDAWDVPLRGGAWYSDKKSLGSGARDRLYPLGQNAGAGFRVVLAPRFD